MAAAADLVLAFTDIGARFESQAGQKVVFTFGSTGLLAHQIENGAPFDLFAAAAESFIVTLEKRGLIVAGTRRLYALGEIVLWLPRSISPPTSLQDLKDRRFRRIALANPEHAPYGMAARDALQSARLWEALQSRLVFGENIQQALRFAQSGNVEAALVARSLVQPGEGNVVSVPDSLYRPLRQTLAVLKASRQPEAARRFADFLIGQEGRARLAHFGFRLPEP